MIGTFEALGITFVLLVVMVVYDWAGRECPYEGGEFCMRCLAGGHQTTQCQFNRKCEYCGNVTHMEESSKSWYQKVKDRLVHKLNPLANWH